MLRFKKPLYSVSPAALGLCAIRSINGITNKHTAITNMSSAGPAATSHGGSSTSLAAWRRSMAGGAVTGPTVTNDNINATATGRGYHTTTRPLLSNTNTTVTGGGGDHGSRAGSFLSGLGTTAREEEDGPSQVLIPCSTTLTIGDIAVPIPDFALRPERVSWVMPGIDHTLNPLLQAVASTPPYSSGGGLLLPTTATPPLFRVDGPLSSSTGGGGGGGGGVLTMPHHHHPQGNMFFPLQDRRTKTYLRWLAQKEALGQDMCLIGEPGPAMRWLVMMYSYLTRREVRVVYLNRDVTESDLKQRREIRNGTLVYEDQAAVAAAKEGQLLVLEGLERVERNVLPVINNLLENREMHLDNGAVLIHPARYDSLLRDLVRDKLSRRLAATARATTSSSSPSKVVDGDAHLTSGHDYSGDNSSNAVLEAKRELANMGLIRVSEKFRVIGITVPVPPYEGNPLDPPLRSRFQCLYVKTPAPSSSSAADGAGGSAFSVLASRGSASSSTTSTTSGGGGGGVLTAKETAAAAAAHERRMDSVRQMRVAIAAVNASTSDFATSSPSSTTTTAGKSGGGGASTSSSSGSAMSSQLNNIGNYELGMLARQAAAFPDAPIGELLVRSFPWPVLARQLPGGNSSGGGGGSVGADEARARLQQFSAIMTRCSITEPMLFPHGVSPITTSASSTPPGRNTPPPPPRQQQQPQSVRQMGNVLKGMIGSTLSGGGATGATAEFIRSAQIVGRAKNSTDGNGSGGSGGGIASFFSTASASSSSSSVAIPVAVEQACNYIVRIENIRTALTLTTNTNTNTNEEGASGEGGSSHLVIADAVVATASCAGGRPGGGPGTYRLPIFMGSAALSPMSINNNGNTNGFNIAEVCPTDNAVFTTELYHVLQTMLQLRATRGHICLLGPTGCGKTAVIREFARVLGYPRETMHLYADMTNKDLFQRRTTDAASGNTTWDNAALVDAAIHGKLVVLDGIDKLPSGGMLASLQQILVDQSESLFDGTVLKSPHEYAILKQRMRVTDPATGLVVYEPSDADMTERKIFPIHPAFCVVATARPPGSESGSSSSGAKPFSLSQDVTTLFGVVTMPEASEETLAPVLVQVARDELRAMAAAGLLTTSNNTSNISNDTVAAQLRVREEAATAAVHRLLKVRTDLDSLRGLDPKIPQLSFRQLLHLVRAAVRYPGDDSFATSIASALLLPLMTEVTATQVRAALAQNGFDTAAATRSSGSDDTAMLSASSALRLLPRTSTATSAAATTAAHDDSVDAGTREFAVRGTTVLRFTRVYTPSELALVPFVTGFYGNPVHEAIIAWLARQFAMGSNTLLIGNQGVGKNKVVDAFLARVRVPRHYIQLHRDTTVGSLTINPTVENGRVQWEDSPLVKAVQLGHCLVVDEIDKASVEVVQVLKGLIEDREMRLGDGRQIIDPALLDAYRGGDGDGGDAHPPRDMSNCIAIHPDFRIIVLANPPGFPFHGNDFFRECGDLFAAHVMGNPDQASQLQVLRAYAPAIPDGLLVSLIQAFMKLQEAFEQGHITYPFSLRELIAVVKHLSRFPQDGVYEALNNVFNFDARDANTLRTVRQVLHTYLDQLSAGKRGGVNALLPLHAGLPKLMKPHTVLLNIPFPKKNDVATAGSNDTDNGATPAGDAFSVSLPTLLVKSPDALRVSLANTTTTTTTTTPSATTATTSAVRFWKESYSKGAYAGEAAPHHHQHRVNDWFTEWAGTMRMPFIRPATDTVLRVFPVSAAAGAEDDDNNMGSSSSLVAFLISRTTTTPTTTDGGGSHGRRVLLLATVHLPPTLLELSEATMTTGVTDGDGGGGLTALGWPVGEAHFIDVTHLAPTASNSNASEEYDDATRDAAELEVHRAVTATDFNVAAHTELFSHGCPTSGGNAHQHQQMLRWPPSAALRTVQQQSRGLLQSLNSNDISGGGVRWPTILMQAPSSSCVLIDVLAGTSPATVTLAVTPSSSTGESNPTTATTATAAAPPSAAFFIPNALLPISREALGIPSTPPTAAASASAPMHVRATSGVLCYAQRNTLYLWTCGRVVAVTLPGPILALNFFTGQLAIVTLAADSTATATAVSSSGSGGDVNPKQRRGILKLVVLRGGGEVEGDDSSGDTAATAHASFAWLPNGLDDGTIVDVATTEARKRALRISNVTTSSSPSSSSEGAAMLTASDLVGAVWVGAAQLPEPPATASSARVTLIDNDTNGGGAASTQHQQQQLSSSSASSSSDIAYMVVEESDPVEGLSLRVYPTFAGRGGPANGSNNTRHQIAAVDESRHELVEAVAIAPKYTPAAFKALSSDAKDHAMAHGETAAISQVVVTSAQHGTIRFFAPLTAQITHFAVSSNTTNIIGNNGNSNSSLAYAYAAAEGQLSIADTNIERVQRRYADWTALLKGNAGQLGVAGGGENGDEVDGDGADGKDFKMEYSTPRKQPSGSLKHGETDDKEHHGGNTWAGGTGGTDTAGLGGIIGPYRLDKGNPVHQVSDEEKKKVPKHLVDEAKRMGKEALKERLKSIGMTEEEYESYKSLQDRVRPAIAQLRTLLTGLKAAEGERAWLKGQTDGVWDDRKLVEGITGEKNVFKRRVDSTESNPFQQKHKKRVVFVLDVSASMYRFEGMDRRLTKLLESTVMVMEAFAGSEGKIEYAMIGHNGDSDCIPLVNFGAPPKNHKERMIICQKMIAYAQYCWSGDNTVDAMKESIKLVTAEKGDSYFVFVVSDANLRQYGITPVELSRIIKSNRQVQMFCIFIATIGQQSSQLQKQLPAGHGYECMRTDMLPHVLRQIFTSVNLL